LLYALVASAQRRGVQRKNVVPVQLGLIAGGLSDGTIGIWNPDAIIKAQEGAEDIPDALVATLAGHEGAVRAWPVRRCLAGYACMLAWDK